MQLTIGNLTNTLLLSIGVFFISFSVLAQTSENSQTTRGLEFSICRGEMVHLSAINQPPTVIQVVDENALPSKPKNSLENTSTLPVEPTGPMIDYNCSPPVLEVTPNTDWTLDENGVVVLLPTETTSYKIQYLSVDECPNGRPTNVTVNVACSAQNNSMIDNFLWLNELVNDEGCGISLIDVYEKNNSKFVYVEAIKGKVLYYEDGSVLCSDANLCLDFYNLSNKKNTWSCKQAKENEEAINQIYDTYPWLEKEVDKDNCTGETITVYDDGNFVFIVVYNGLDGYQIFDETGLYSYFSAVRFSFLDDFEPFKRYSWACNGDFSVRKPATKAIVTNSFKLYPNPTKNKVFLSLNLTKIPFFSKPMVKVYTTTGQLLMQTQGNEEDFFANIVELDVSSLTNGMYLIELQSNDHFSYEKLLIE